MPDRVLPKEEIQSLSEGIHKAIDEFSAEKEPEISGDLFDELLSNLERVLEPFILAFLKDDAYRKKFGLSEVITSRG